MADAHVKPGGALCWTDMWGSSAWMRMDTREVTHITPSSFQRFQRLVETPTTTNPEAKPSHSRTSSPIFTDLHSKQTELFLTFRLSLLKNHNDHSSCTPIKCITHDQTLHPPFIIPSHSFSHLLTFKSFKPIQNRSINLHRSISTSDQTVA